MHRLFKTLCFCLVVLTAGFGQNTHYYVLFSARFTSLAPFSKTGHAFVTVRSEDSVFQKVEQLTYGFFPKKGLGIFQNTEGVLIEGYVKNSNKERFVRRFIIEIDSLVYVQVLNLSVEWQSKPYNLLDQNCVHFMDAIAQIVNLKTPSPKLCTIFPRRPSRYIAKLKQMNHERIIRKPELEKARLRILKKADIEQEEDEDDKQN